MIRRLITTDTHGNYRGLIQALERADFDKSTDYLYFLGDAVDGGPDSYDVLRFLEDNAKVIILGNHDEWLRQHWKSNGSWREDIWLRQGGKATIKSLNDNEAYFKNRTFIDRYFEKAVPYATLDKELFVHAGFDVNLGLKETLETDLYWSRELITIAHDRWARGYNTTGYSKVDSWRRIYIGHTDVSLLQKFSDMGRPALWCNVWALDTGAGSNGRVTVFDMDTEDYWQSNTVKELYGYEFYRN